MAAIIGALRAELSASLAQWQSDMGKAADSLKGFSRAAEQQAKSLERIGTRMSIAITAPLALLAKSSLTEAKAAREAMGQVEAALTSSGGASGKTADQLQKTAKALQNISTFDDDDILRNVTANLLTFSNIQGPVFDRAQKSVVDLASRMGGDLQGAAIKVGRALQDPIKGLQAFTRLGVSFTDAEQKQIKALVQHGQGLEAQGIILDKLGTKFDGAAQKMRDAQPDAVLTQNWRDFQETIGQIEMKLLPALTSQLKGVFDWFQNLSPTTQEWAVKLGLVLAVVGPILVIFGKLTSAVGTLVPVMKGLWVIFSGLELATIGWIAGLVALVTAVVIFWKSVKDVLHGDFAKAWEDAKDTAAKVAKQIKGIFASTPTGPTGKAGAKADTGQGFGAKPGKLNFNLDNAADLKKTEDAAKALGEALNKLDMRIAQGLDATHLPAATTQANALNAQLDDYVKNAKSAGVNTGKFSGKIDELRGRIETLKVAALAKEAQTFSRAVDASGIAVKRFAAGSLDPLNEKLDTVDTAYESLRDQITKSIEDNAALAGSNDQAASAMARLQKQLAQLDDAHQAARDAAVAQFNAEEKLADLQTAANNDEAKRQLRDLRDASGLTPGLSSHQQDLQSATDALARQANDVGQNLVKLEEAREKAVMEGYDAEAERLSSEIDLQTQLYDLVQSTSAEQIVATKIVNDSFNRFADDLAQNLTDTVANWKGDLDGLRGIFKQLASDLFLKPAISAGTDAFGGLLKSFLPSFAGAHAAGGYIPPGQWGIVGEKGPEAAFGGASGLQVQPNTGGGTTQVFNITTPDANSFRRSQRQISRAAKQRFSLA